MQLEGSGLLSAQPKKTGKEPGTWTGDNSDQWGHHQDRSGGLSDTVGPIHSQPCSPTGPFFLSQHSCLL